jgi:ribosomal-protein-alanine N-acetyltransferase
VSAASTDGTIRTERLDLVALALPVMEALVAGDAGEASRLAGISVPADWPAKAGGFLPIFRDRLAADPAAQPWLFRAMVLRRPPGRPMIGHIGFHFPPDQHGMVELGYTVFPEHRRAGYATEAVRALMDWAAGQPGVTRFRASVSPTNEPSLAVIGKLGFSQTGSQWDEEDGEKLIFELIRRPGGVGP